MRVLIILALFLAIPAAGFSQDTQQVVDGENQMVPSNGQPEKSKVSTEAAGTGDAVDVVGGTDNISLNKIALAKGNSYRVDIDVTLTEAEFWLEFSTTQTLRFYVFHSRVEFGTYDKIFETSKSVTGSGAGWYSSDAIAVPLLMDNHYIIAVSWNGTLSYFYNSGDSEATSFGSYVHGYALGTDPLGATITSTSNDQAIYHQRLTTEAGGDPFTVDNNQISSTTGGSSIFTLDAGVENANRNYLIFGSITGTTPGTPLPGGLVILPLNWDGFTNLVLNMLSTSVFKDFLGGLDASGMATASFNLPPVPGFTATLIFAYALNNPWDFVSNPVEIYIVP